MKPMKRPGQEQILELKKKTTCYGCAKSTPSPFPKQKYTVNVTCAGAYLYQRITGIPVSCSNFNCSEKLFITG
jgi:hypothetical protein